MNEMGKKVGACEARLGAEWTKQHECWREREYACALARARGLAHLLSVARRLFSIWRQRKYLGPWAGLSH